MNPWADAVVRLGVPTVFLGLVLWKLWPLVTGFIAKAESRALAAEKRAEQARDKLEESAKVQLTMAQKMSADFADVLGKYNENSREIARQLGVVAQSVKTLAAPKAKR